MWLASGFYIVDAGQRGMVLRFGKFVEETMPGPHWHLPYPIETAEIVNLSQVRTVEVGSRNGGKSKVPKESLMLTDDENIIDIQFAVQYVVKNPQEYLFANRAPDDSVLQAAETAMREIVGKNTMDLVLYKGRAQITSDAQKLMQEILDRYHTGISISKVTMQNAQPPEQVQAAFDDAVKAGPGPRAAEKRRPGLRERRRAASRGRGRAPDAGSRRLQAARDGARRGRCQPVSPDRRGIQQGAGRHARPPLYRRDAGNH